MERLLNDTEAQLAFGVQLACVLPTPCVIYLEGDLGAGKTTLTRGILRGLGHQGAVRSPTYTLIEPYALATRRVQHLDLYRLSDPEELEYLGLRDLFGDDVLWVIEWPERGKGMLPLADLQIEIQPAGAGRRLTLHAHTACGQTVIDALHAGHGRDRRADQIQPQTTGLG